MSKSNPLDFLTDEEIIVPTGGTGMGNQGFIAPWSGAGLYVVFADVSPDVLNGVKPQLDRVMGESGYHRYYFNSYEDGTKAAELVNAYKTETVGAGNFNPVNAPQNWVFLCNTKEIINAAKLDKVIEGFGPNVLYEVQISSLKAPTHLHEWHLITLPSIVAAAANMMIATGDPDFQGIEPVEFDVSELARGDDYVSSDEMQAKLVGSPDAKKKDDPNYFWNSVFGKRRIALWKALGEDNPEVFEPIGSKDKKGEPSKHATTSKALSKCLRVYKFKWSRPVWCQVDTVADPRHGAVNKKNGKRNTLPVMYRMFPDADEAKVYAASVMRPSEDGGGNGSTPPESLGKPPYPGVWAESPEDWESALATAFAEGKKPAEIVKEMGDCTVKDVIAWKKFLAL